MIRLKKGCVGCLAKKNSMKLELKLKRRAREFVIVRS